MAPILPVTLISGFLGSGKTTLLDHILRNKENLKCAVIVNDMASINIDAALIEKSSVLQKEEKLVKLQNGCICCTLRGDLLEEISRLAKLGEFDYLVIESTGISEPMQVAETFAMTKEELSMMQGEGEGEGEEKPLESLVGIAQLDTCVTVVDSTSFFDYFNNAKFLPQEFQNTDELDDRTVVDLLMDQIEFADVILVNKVDVCPPETLKSCLQLIKKLNPNAQVIESTYSKVDLKSILNTQKFDFAKAQLSPGWLQSLKEPHVPETLEYGIGSFVFTARKPFHPQRLHDLLAKYFMIIEISDLKAPPNEMEGIETEEGNNSEENDSDNEMEEQDEEDLEEDEDMEEEEWADEQEPVRFDEDEVKTRSKARANSAYKGLFRSKGFIWIATRPHNMGEWSQAGLILTIGNGGNWFVDLPKSMWPQEKIIQQEIQKDFDGELGDKRQELVLIGQFSELEKNNIIKDLESCLVTPKEWKKYLKMDMNNWQDPWEEWDYYVSDDE